MSTIGALRQRVIDLYRQAVANGAVMAAAALIGIGAVLAASALVAINLIEDTADEQALKSQLANAQTFVELAVDPAEVEDGRLGGATYAELTAAASRTAAIDEVGVWTPDGLKLPRRADVRASTPPPVDTWTSAPTSLLDGSGAVRSFLLLGGAEDGQPPEMIEVRSSGAGSEAIAGSRQSTTVLIVAALAALLYAAITAPVLRGASAIAERRRRRHHTLQRELLRAMENGEISLAFQPKGDLKKGGVRAVEALARWEHPRRGSQPPMSYFPRIEQTEVIRPLSVHLFDMALRQQREWSNRGLELDVAVNVPATALNHAPTVDELLDRIDLYRAPGCGVTVEITENAIGGEDIVDAIHRLKAAGVRISLDDFGKGQSSLSRLASLPFDEIKVDRAFIRGLDSPGGPVMVRAMLELGHELGASVVAEGVEWGSTALWLRDQGFESIQGFLLSKPVSAAALEAWLPEEGNQRLAAILQGSTLVEDGRTAADRAQAPAPSSTSAA